jgi:predicted GNAT family acetyltransferase
MPGLRHSTAQPCAQRRAPAVFGTHGVYLQALDPEARPAHDPEAAWPTTAGAREWLDSRVEITVVDVPERERFEARAEDGTPAGVLTYQLTGPIIAYTHTKVEPEFEHHGVGATLARAVMEDARSKGRTVVPICPFLSGWLDEHHEYDAMLARSHRRIK